VKPVAVVGIGNYLLGDEGAGIHAVDRLRRRGVPGNTEVIDGGTAGSGLRFFLEGRREVFFIDAGDFGASPGEYRRFEPGDVVSRKSLPGFSLHEFDLVDYLDSIPRAERPPLLVIYCIQAERISPGTELSPAVSAGLDRLLEDLMEELGKGGS